MAIVPDGRPAPESVEPPMRFMMFPLGFLLAHVGRLVEIGTVLRGRGHEVLFAGAYPDHHRSRLDIAEKAGFRVVAMKEPDHPYAWDRFQKYGWLATAVDLARHQQWAPLDEILDSQIRLIHEHRPDMLVCDASITTSTASHITGVPAAGVMNAYALRLISPGSLFRPMIEAWDWTILARIRKRIYKKYGVQPRKALDLLHEMPMLSPDLDGLYEAPHRAWTNFHTVGPIYSEPIIELPEWYGELDDGRTNVYITMGSTGFLDDFLRKTYRALGALPYRFLVTTAGQTTPETEAMAPPNFRFARYAPGSKLLDKCAAMIYHGGNGSMYQALAAGVPMIAVPSHLEQEICAGLAVRHGFGLTVPARKVRGEAVAAMLERIIQDPAFRAGAEGFSGRVRLANGAQRAAGLLEEIARERRSPQRASAPAAL